VVTALYSQQARFVRIKFESLQERFNISEVRIFGQTNDTLAADLSVTKSHDSNHYTPGTVLTYNIELTNLGPDNANGSVITDALPPELTNATWTCRASAGAVCPNQSGSGNIDEVIALLPNGIGKVRCGLF
jgi:uncharacterized repeat protein (TIGR01451 family)